MPRSRGARALAKTVDHRVGDIVSAALAHRAASTASTRLISDPT
jgi:hypothetical protein